MLNKKSKSVWVSRRWRRGSFRNKLCRCLHVTCCAAATTNIWLFDTELSGCSYGFLKLIRVRGVVRKRVT